MHKKSILIILIVVLLLSLLSGSVSAQTRSSYYFNSYSASLRQGSTSGIIALNYDVK